EQAGLNFEHPAVGDAVPEPWVGDLGVHPALVGAKEALSSVGGQRDPSCTDGEVRGSDLAVVDEGENSRLHDEGPELFGQVEREGWAAVARPVVEADVRIEADQKRGDGEVFDQLSVTE